MTQLVHKASREIIEEGSEIMDFRGAYSLVEGWQAPSEPGKSGYVYTNHGRFYPSVFDLEFID